MKIKISLITLLLISLIVSSQEKLEKISRDGLVGQKIKFLSDHDNKYGYQGFGKDKDTHHLDYEEYKQRTATISKKEDNLYTVTLDDNGEIVYFRFWDEGNLRNYIGILSLLENAKKLYLDKIFYNKFGEKCKIIEIEFAEDDVENQQNLGPYNLKYKRDKDTVMINLHFTETYGPKDGYKYNFEKNNVFEYMFSSQKPQKLSRTYLFGQTINKQDYYKTVDYLSDYFRISKIAVKFRIEELNLTTYAKPKEDFRSVVRRVFFE